MKMDMKHVNFSMSTSIIAVCFFTFEIAKETTFLQVSLPL